MTAEAGDDMGKMIRNEIQRSSIDGYQICKHQCFSTEFVSEIKIQQFSGNKILENMIYAC